MFFGLAEELFASHGGEFSALCEAFQKELRFMLVKAKLGFSLEEVQLILDAYICLLSRCNSLQ